MKDQIKEFVEFLNETYGNENRFFRAKPGTNYFKISVTNYGQTSAYGFVARKHLNNKTLGAVTPGDILRPATWNRPAKHARGQLFDRESWSCCGEFGIEYLK